MNTRTVECKDETYHAVALPTDLTDDAKGAIADDVQRFVRVQRRRHRKGGKEDVEALPRVRASGVGASGMREDGWQRKSCKRGRRRMAGTVETQTWALECCACGTRDRVSLSESPTVEVSFSFFLDKFKPIFEL